MADELATRVIARHRRRLDGPARCITIDLDPTDDTAPARVSNSQGGRPSSDATRRTDRQSDRNRARLPLELQMIPVLAYHQPYAGIGVPGFGGTDEAHGP